MDIQKNESCKRLLAFVFCLCSVLAHADDSGAFSTLKESYQMPEGMDAPAMIEKLRQSGQTCADAMLKKRIQYRTGMLYFKTQDLQRAHDCFERIAKDPDCPAGLLLAGINMAAQTARMQGRDGSGAQVTADIAVGVFHQFGQLGLKVFRTDAEVFQCQRDI